MPDDFSHTAAMYIEHNPLKAGYREAHEDCYGSASEREHLAHSASW